MLTPIRAILSAGILLVIFLLAREVLGWRTDVRIVTSRQKGLRIASALLTIAIMAMILAGDNWLAVYGPFALMAYWMVCFGLAVGLLLLTLMDFKEVGLRFGDERKEIIKEIVKPDKKEDANDE